MPHQDSGDVSLRVPGKVSKEKGYFEVPSELESWREIVAHVWIIHVPASLASSQISVGLVTCARVWFGCYQVLKYAVPTTLAKRAPTHSR